MQRLISMCRVASDLDRLIDGFAQGQSKLVCERAGNSKANSDEKGYRNHLQLQCIPTVLQTPQPPQGFQQPNLTSRSLHQKCTTKRQTRDQTLLHGR